MKLTLQAVQVANGHDEEGRLVFADGRLIAVLVQLSDMHEEQGGPDTGSWRRAMAAAWQESIPPSRI